MSDANQRKYPRANYPCSLTIWHGGSGQSVIMANTANIGAGGMFVHLNEKIVPGTVIDVSITFPDQGMPFKCSGYVLRCESSDAETTRRFFALAIRFDALNDAQFVRLQQTVDNLIAREQRNKK